MHLQSVIREGEFRPSSGLTIIVVIIITVTVPPPRSMRTSMQLLSPVWEDYTPPPFCGNRFDDDDPISSSFAPTTTTTTTEEDEEKTTCSSNDTTTAEQSNKNDATIIAAVIALFVIIREKLLQWSKPKVRLISRDVRTRKPVKIVSLQRTPKKAAAAAGRNNNNNNNRRSRKPAAHRHRWTVRSMNPLRVLAKIPEAYVNVMNGVGRSPAFSSPGMPTFHVVSHNPFPPGRTRDHEIDDFSSRQYYYTSDESIEEILHLDSRRSTSNSKPVDHSDYAAVMDQYHYHYRSSSISPGPDSSASSLDSNAARGMNMHNFRRSNSTTKFRDRCDLQFLNS